MPLFLPQARFMLAVCGLESAAADKLDMMVNEIFLHKIKILAAAAGIIAGFCAPAQAERIRNPVAVFSGLDKITGRTTVFDVRINETYQFGSLQISPRVCYTNPPDEAVKTDGFVEVNEITLDQKIKRIFTGWMFADSPGLNAVDHPIYDVWLINCKQSSRKSAGG